MKKAASLLPLCAGLVLGSSAAWALLRFAATGNAEPMLGSSAPSSSSTASTSSGAPLPSTPGAQLLLPPPLAGAEADAALDAYLALPPLAKDATADVIQTRLGQLRALLTLLPATHFERLLAALATRTGDAEAQLRRVAFEIWTEQDAPVAARWALALVPGDAINAAARSRYVTQAALAWSRLDFSAAWAWSGALADADLRKSLLPRLLGALAVTDPQKALSLAASVDETLLRAARRSIFDTWAQRDPAAALRNLGPTLLVEHNNETYIVHQALVKWVARDPASALDWALEQPTHDESHRNLLTNVGWYITENPAAVRPFVDLLTRRDDIPNRASVLQNLFGSWQNKDSAAALTWLDTLPDLAERSDLVSRALGYVPVEKPEQFMALVQRLPASPQRDEQVSQRLANWAETDPDAAAAWLAQNDTPELASASRKVEGVLLAKLAATDPQTALARWQALPSDSARGEMSVQLAKAWAKSDPAAATRWFTQQLPSDSASFATDPAAQRRSYELSRVASNWLRVDPVAYVDWAQSLPQGVQREQAVSALSNHWIYHENESDPPPRAGYANQLAKIKDDDLRSRALQTHLSQWLSSDVQAARAWIESSDALSPENAARLLTQSETVR